MPTRKGNTNSSGYANGFGFGGTSNDSGSAKAASTAKTVVGGGK